ncbi:hypothetical protein [Methylobacterium nodulans]|uniref:hypothetical protein n=1 Tax=Methylobacterium nodulans TaxID=114616 RepID=UPI00016193AD|nr:hypothetical protein [Methylobacterium nodulans]
MPKHRTHSAAFMRQVAQEARGGETLHGLAKRHDLSRNLIRIWVEKDRLHHLPPRAAAWRPPDRQGAGVADGRGHHTVFDMTGLALQDMTVACMLQRRATEGGRGTRIPWPW